MSFAAAPAPPMEVGAPASQEGLAMSVTSLSALLGHPGGDYGSASGSGARLVAARMQARRA
jgi:hypothetical protein